ncbi:MAG: DUF5615 family PIN-like protein [Chromatiales bacterium]|nr:DUF5615 family PIN-like protein [Chromatiales bacterium]
MVRFLADESCDYAVVRTLAGLGHEVLAVADMSPRADDESVIGLALRERCVLFTEDKDFGQLVHASGLESTGVVLLRFPAGARSRIGEEVANLVNGRGDDLYGRFVVLQPGRARIGPRHFD